MQTTQLEKLRGPPPPTAGGTIMFGMSTSTFAEHAAARTDKLAPKPANLSFGQAAAVPVSGGSALQAVRNHGRVHAGEKVLSIGASGGVGSFAVQIAKAYGADVTGVCSTTKVDMVRALGADSVIDYTREDFAAGGPRYDVILDIGGNARLSPLRRALTPRGRLVIVRRDPRTAARRQQPPDPGPDPVPVRQPETGHLRRVGEHRRPERPPRAHRGRQAHPAIDRTYPLAETPAAIRHLLDGQARGKLVISVSPRNAQSPDPGSTP